MSPAAGILMVLVALFPFAVLFLALGGYWLGIQMGWFK